MKAGAEEDREDRKTFLNEIVRELRRRPEKIKACHRAVMSDVYLSTDDLSYEAEVKFFKVLDTEELLRLMLLVDKNERMTPMVLKMLRRGDKHVVRKLFSAVFAVEQDSCIMTRKKARLARELEYRSSAVGLPIDEIKFSPEGEVLWEQCGLYRLTPPCHVENPTAEQLEGHVFTGLEFKSFKVPHTVHTQLVVTETIPRVIEMSACPPRARSESDPRSNHTQFGRIA